MAKEVSQETDMLSFQSKIQKKKAYVPGCTRLDMHQYYYHDSSLMIKDWFPIEPAFSITVDKAQVGFKPI